MRLISLQDSHKELFLDILTKEEKEALLNKKMEDIRKRNEALQKRHAVGGLKLKFHICSG